MEAGRGKASKPPPARVVMSAWSEVRAEAILRSVTADLDPDTALSREVEREAGEEVVQRLRAAGELPVGAAVITPGGSLAFDFIIHVVLQSADEPVTREGVRSALRNGLRRAGEWGLGSLVLPPLGTGAGNLDSQESASLMISLLTHHLREMDDPPEVTIVVGSEYEREVFADAVGSSRGPTAGDEG